MSANRFSRQLEQWLTSFNLSGDPFAIHEADQEQQLLSKVFVDRPYLHNIFGDPAHPQAAILKADRGGGKTATREMAAYECLHGKMQRRVLPVRYNHFDHLLGQVQDDPTRITIRHHLRSISRLILGEIRAQISPHQLESLSEDERSLLRAYSAEYADPITQIFLNKALNAPSLEVDWEGMTPLETLSLLAQLVSRLPVSEQKRAPESELRFCSIYVLVDRVDESEAGPEAALPILAPLVGQGPLMNMPNMAFKYFLPIEVADNLMKDHVVRPDRLCIEEITWSEEALRSIIDQRLLYFSNGYISHFEELCSTSLRSIAMHRLIEACGWSPRALIRLCRALIYTHLESETSGMFFDRTDLTNAIQTFKQEQQHEQPQEVLVVEGLTPAENKNHAETQPEQGLYIDRSGHVWVDNRQTTETFSEQEYRLLSMLYKKSPKVVPPEELIQAIWRNEYPLGESVEMIADGQNLRKLVGRVRERLEPDSQGKASRFIKNARGRGYWLKKN